MSDLEKHFTGDEEKWLPVLKDYQRNIVNDFLKNSSSYNEAAEKWISSSPDQTVPFGSSPNRINKEQYFEKFMEELEKFLCGDERYEEERKKIVSKANLTETTIVSSVSSALAPYVGSAGPFLVPVVVLTFMTITKMSKNAWCEARKEKRENL